METEIIDIEESPKKNASTPKVQQQHSTPQMASPASKQEEEGKEFFRQAKNKLSFKQFTHLTNIIKKLNNRQQSKQETLMEAKKLFGPEHEDLYEAFSKLLNHTQEE